MQVANNMLDNMEPSRITTSSLLNEPGDSGSAEASLGTPHMPDVQQNQEQKESYGKVLPDLHKANDDLRRAMEFQMNAFDQLRTDLLEPLLSRDEAEAVEALLLPNFLTEADMLQLFDAARGLQQPPSRLSGLCADDKQGSCRVEPGKHGTRYSATHTALNLHCGGYFAGGWPGLCDKITHGMRSQPGRWSSSDVPRRESNRRHASVGIVLLRCSTALSSHDEPRLSWNRIVCNVFFAAVRLYPRAALLPVLTSSRLTTMPHRCGLIRTAGATPCTLYRTAQLRCG